jgi:hypothetical protein
MKKKAATSAILLVLFIACTIGRTIARTEEWATKHSHHSQRFSQRGETGTAYLDKQTPHPIQTKLLEDGWVLEVSFVRVLNTPPRAANLAHVLPGFVPEPNNRALSSRAPPGFLS